jgi:hypothetical protein
MEAFKLRDVYEPHRPSPVARLEVVSVQYAHHCQSDAIKDTLLALTMGDKLAHFGVSGMNPLRKMLPDYTPTIDRHF